MKKDKGPEWISDTLAVVESGVIISMGTDFIGLPEATSPKPKLEAGQSSGVAFWGDDNQYPQNVLDLANEDLELLPLLDKKARILHGRELVAVQVVFDEKSNDMVVRRINNQKINDFLSHRLTRKYWREGCVDFTWYHNIWPDLYKSKDQKTIAAISTHDALWCRWGQMNEKGVIEKCYVSAEWDKNPKIDEKDKVHTHPVVNPYDFNAVEKLRGDKKITRFVYPTNYPSPGQAYYPIAAWHKYLFSDWHKIKKLIPQWKVKTMQKVLSAKFILTIPINYWPQKYPGWKKGSAAEREAWKKETVTEINDKLTGMEGVGSTILSEVGFNQEGQELPRFNIIPIESGIKEGFMNEDSQEASQFMMRSLDLDPTIVGNGPGRGKDAGSGSDKRVAFNIMVALLQPYRDVIMEPLDFIAEYNGWTTEYPGFRLKVLEIQLETLDKAHATAKETNPVTQKEEL